MIEPDLQPDRAGRAIRYPLGNVLRDVSYDAADRINGFTHLLASDGTPQPALDQSFGYDENSRLTGIVTSTASWAIAYDPNGNRTSVSLNGVPSTYTTEAMSNRLTSVTNPARSFNYDNAGNTTSDSAGYTATYGLNGSIASITKAGVTGSYDYDAERRRIRKVTSTGDVVIFVYDLEGQLLGEYDQTGQAIREYVWLDNIPVAMFMPDPANASGPPIVHYIHADHLNAPRVVVDQTAAKRWRWIAEPFGTTAPETSPEGLGVFTQNLRFPGQYADAESGLWYNHFRFYAADGGAYRQSDPVGLAGGINTYAYVDGNPLSYYDPYGLFGMDDVWGAIYIGTGGWSPSQETVDFGSGFGDVVTFGLSKQARSLLDLNNVNRCSKWYTAGEVAGVVVSTATGFAGGSRAFARQASPNSWSNFSHSATPAKWNRGSWWSRTGNRANGDYIPTTGNRPDLHDLMDATAAGIGGKFPTWPAWRRAINRVPYTPGGALYGGASAAMNDPNDCECSK